MKTAWIKKLSENKTVLSSHDVIYIIYFFRCFQYGLYKGLYIYIYAYVNESIDICLIQIYTLQTLFMPFYLNILSCFGRWAHQVILRVGKGIQAADDDGLN